MATNDLTDNYIALTYQGVIHSRGEQLPSSGRVPLYDGVGNRSPISIGRIGNGATIWSLSATDFYANGLRYPLSDGTNNQVMVTDGNGILSFKNVNELFSGVDGIDANITEFSTVKITVENGVITALQAEERRPQIRTLWFLGEKDTNKTTYPTNTKVATWISTVWSDPKEGDKAIVIYNKSLYYAVISTRIAPASQWVYQFTYTGGAWTIDSGYPTFWLAGGGYNDQTWSQY